MKTSRVQQYPAPKTATLSHDYILKIRPKGVQQWQQISTYRAMVDMHDVRDVSVAIFDFQGSVEVEVSVPELSHIYCVDIRPLSLNIPFENSGQRVRFTLENPANISLEINRDRHHNLHLFAGKIEPPPEKTGRNTVVIQTPTGRNPVTFGNDCNAIIESLPYEERLVYIEPGLHYLSEGLWRIPSGTRVYLEGGAVLMGGLVVDHAQKVKIYGRGIVNPSEFSRFTGVKGVRISHSTEVEIEGITFINPPHYTIGLESSRNIALRNIKTFSCEGWSDGIDMVSSRNITVDGCFIRTSDDCIAIYASRGKDRGGVSNITVKNSTLWADVAHPINIGTHGDYDGPGDVLEDLLFENIDILEHHEFQPGYLGTMSINAGDKNTVRRVTFRDIRVEPFAHGKLLDVQVKKNPDYNPAPGRGIEDILFEDIRYTSSCGEEPSVIQGYGPEHLVQRVTIRNLIRDKTKACTLKEAGIVVGEYTRNIVIE